MVGLVYKKKRSGGNDYHEEVLYQKEVEAFQKEDSSESSHREDSLHLFQLNNCYLKREKCNMWTGENG